MRARKKPVEVNIECYDGSEDSVNRIRSLAIGPYQLSVTFGELYIHTLEGMMHASVGDYVIQGVHGELYPCKPEIFDKTYEIIEE